MNNVVVTNNLTFRWDADRHVLVVTTPNGQYELNADQALEVCELLYQNKQEIFRACYDLPEPEIPTWASPES